jgi:hypothetical protein
MKRERERERERDKARTRTQVRLDANVPDEQLEPEVKSERPEASAKLKSREPTNQKLNSINKIDFKREDRDRKVNTTKN